LVEFLNMKYRKKEELIEDLDDQHDEGKDPGAPEA
jgi:hypothetical protein